MEEPEATPSVESLIEKLNIANEKLAKLGQLDTRHETPAETRTRELKETLLANPNLKNVYFDSQGRHYFRQFQATDGRFYSRMATEASRDKNSNKIVHTLKPIADDMIVTTISSEDWLKANS